VFGVSGFGSRDSSLGFRVLGILGYRFRVSGFDFQVLSFGFGVSYFGFQVSTFRF